MTSEERLDLARRLRERSSPQLILETPLRRRGTMAHQEQVINLYEALEVLGVEEVEDRRGKLELAVRGEDLFAEEGAQG